MLEFRATMRSLFKQARTLAIAASCAVVVAAGLAKPAAAGIDRCLAMAGSPARVHRVALRPATVRITFRGHASFLIESPQGVRAATDYADEAGDAPAGTIPDIVTMNIAHEMHWSATPDKRISHVLQGWNPLGGKIRHDLTLKDMRVRNVPTNLRGSDGTTTFSQNSIFIFEVGGLCIAHLGHLHHTLTPGHLAMIGQMDIVMVPVDGSFTLDIPGMLETLKQLQPRLILPMHYFGDLTLARFLDGARKSYPIHRADTSTIIVSTRTLPLDTQVLLVPEAGFPPPRPRP